ncbi:hypothetical protein CIK04_04435 [Vibrio sp. 03_296]|nr:hypothetical protein CIK04_04435 [Vibrio sp. 03_296]PJO13857.1 hypothetical protein COO31_005840 [Vibrio vulnificus]
MRKFTTIEMDVCCRHQVEAVFYRFDALGSMSFVLWVLAAEWIPDSSLRLIRNDVLFDYGSVAL